MLRQEFECLYDCSMVYLWRLAALTINYGYAGLVAGDIRKLYPSDVSDLIGRKYILYSCIVLNSGKSRSWQEKGIEQ